MSHRSLFLTVCLCLGSLASCAREDGDSSSEIMAQAAGTVTPGESPSAPAYSAQQARLEWLARPDAPSDAFGPAGGE